MYVNGEIVKRKDAIHIDDVRDLVLHIIADSPPPNWVKIENPRSIQKVVTLLIPGLLPDFLSLPPLPTSATTNPNVPLSIPLPSDSETPIPFIASTFSHACPTRAPGDQTRMFSVLGTFFQGPVSAEEKKKRIEARIASERAFDKDPTLYLLSLPQMIENDYPIPSYMADVFEKPPGWVETPQPVTESILLLPPEKQRSRVYAIDCEMCLTEDGKELTRVCIVEYESGIVVYDKLVKPPKPVIDYLTKWSGITEASLAIATTTLGEVQQHLLTILAPKDGPTSILVGHSLESDLKALRICHPLCIDTALIYHHPRGRPLKPGLAWLTKKWCRREIQTKGEGGHDPEEDALACVDLLRLKIQYGAGFGEFKTDFESIFERMARASGRGGPGSVRGAVVDHGNPSVMHGSKATTTIGCSSDEEVLDGLLQAIPAHEFVFGRFTGLADAMGWLTPKATGDAPVVVVPISEPSPEVLSAAQAKLDEHLVALYTSLPARTAVVIFTGHSDPRRMSALNARKSAFESAIKSGKKAEDIDRSEWWTASDGRELEEEVEKAKRGLLFLGIK
ncbi:ribonuclease H-like protein [Paxillus ammoniavirescens]|nr:ribonuclease H-like protein [Paxillus ammoniavirescens]